MDKRVLVVLDNPLLEHDPWADEVFRQAKLVAVDNDTITTAMSKDPESRKALLTNSGDPMGAAEKLAPYYRRALETLYGEQPRLGLYGTAWLVHTAAVDACVVDWSEVEARAGAPGVSEADAGFSRQMAKDYVHQRTSAHLAPGRLLELEPGLPQTVKVARTLEFLRTRGLLG